MWPNLRVADNTLFDSLVPERLHRMDTEEVRHPYHICLQNQSNARRRKRNKKRKDELLVLSNLNLVPRLRGSSVAR
jgi:hypothetical protein